METVKVVRNSTLVHAKVFVPACCRLYTIRTHAATMNMLPMKSILQNSLQGCIALPNPWGQSITRENMQTKPAGILQTSQLPEEPRLLLLLVFRVSYFM